MLVMADDSIRTGIDEKPAIVYHPRRRKRTPLIASVENDHQMVSLLPGFSYVLETEDRIKGTGSRRIRPCYREFPLAAIHDGDRLLPYGLEKYP